MQHYQQTPTRRLLSILYTLLLYGLVPAVLIFSLAAHVHFRSALTDFIMDAPLLGQLRGSIWLFTAVLFLLRCIRTPRKESRTRFYLLLLVSFCMFAGFEELRWGAYLPGFGFLGEGHAPRVGFSLIQELKNNSAQPVLVLCSIVLGFYGCLLPSIALAQNPPTATRRYLFQVIPLPSIAPWFLIGGVLAAEQFGLLALHAGRLILALSFLLIALTPLEQRLRFRPPNSALVFTFMLGVISFSVILLEAGERVRQSQRLAEVHAMMLEAVTTNNTESLLNMLRNDEGKEAMKSVPLIVKAASLGNHEMVQALLRMGADPNLADENGRTPLEVAATEGLYDTTLTLLWAQADPNRAHERSTTALIAAIKAKRLQILTLLLSNGADPNQADASGQLPLLAAARYDFAPAINSLIQAGANPKARNALGQNAIEIAPEESITKDLLMTLLLSDEEYEARQGPPMLIVNGSPSLVFSSAELLSLFEVEIRNIGKSTARELKIQLSNGEQQFELEGPNSLAPGEAARFRSTSSIEGDRRGIEVSSSCSRCEENIKAPLSNFSDTFNEGSVNGALKESSTNSSGLLDSENEKNEDANQPASKSTIIYAN